MIRLSAAPPVRQAQLRVTTRLRNLHTTNRKLRALLASALLLAACSSAPAPASNDAARPYAGLEARPIKALAPERVADLLAGRGASYALAAELNSYPGPRHVLDLASELALSPAQRREAEEAYAAMQAEAKQLGKQLVEREAALDRAFGDGSVTTERLVGLTAEMAELDGKLRAVHLHTHLIMRAALTPEQIARYDQLRGYAGNGAPQQRGHGGH